MRHRIGTTAGQSAYGNNTSVFVKCGGLRCSLFRDVTQRRSVVIGVPGQIGCPETSVTIDLRCVAFQKS